MNRLSIVFFGLMVIGAFAQAATITAFGDNGGPLPNGLDRSRMPISITQNHDTSYMDPEGSVACGDDGVTYQNWYLRRFELANYGINHYLRIFSVDFGVQQYEGPAGYSIDIVLFKIPTGDYFWFANMTEFARVNVPLDTADIGTFINVPITSGIFMGDDLVVAIDAPPGGANMNAFRPAVNDAGVTHDSYIAASTCGVSEPTSVSVIGFPEAQLILVVNGDADPCIATEPQTFSKIKSLY